MRQIKQIIIHCSATKETDNYSVEELELDHIDRGFRTIGYHYYITKNGILYRGRPIWQMGAHVKGMNKDSVGICYEGGLDKNGKPKDTRTEAQKKTLNNIIEDLVDVYETIEEIKGHRDYSPDLNHDGQITSNEWLKACPCFDVIPEFKHLLR